MIEIFGTVTSCSALIQFMILPGARRRSAAGELTPTERRVAELAAQGLANKEIAQGLKIGPATVKNHVHSILDKLKVKRRAAIAGRVLETSR